MKLTDKTKAFLYCILSGLLFGPIGFFGTMVMNEGISISNMLFWRYAISLGFLFLILLPKISYLKFDASVFRFQILIGILLYGPFSYLYFKASALIRTGLAMVLLFTYPAFVMAIRALFFKKKIPKIYLASIAIVFSGLLLIIEIKSMKADIWGIIFALLCAIFYATYIVATNSRINTASPLTASITISIGGIIFSLLAVLYENTFKSPYALDI